ncbi:MAG: trimethylamine methyltransferase family protein [Sphingobacterium sp.]|nr:trimethylamine methyltransferase family protein [Sphingobacterium sp.]
MTQIVPKISVLQADAIAEVHARSLEILATVGVRVDSPRARDILARAAGGAPADGRVRIPAELVAWALGAAPANVPVFKRTGEPAFTLGPGGGGTRFGIGATNLYYQDPLTDVPIPFTRAHIAASTRLGDALPAYDVVSTVGVLRDFSPEEADIYATLEMAANTTKSLVLLVSEAAAFEPALDMLEALCGNLSEKPFVVPYFNPVSPLVINEGTSDMMSAAIARGLPVIYSNYGMSGATAPITPAGTLVMLNAELLAGLVLAQLMREGAPVILGSLPAGFDMATAVSYYGPETMLLNVACAEMMAHYRLPHCGTSGSGAGWGADLPAADLLWMNHLTSCLGRAGLAPSSGATSTPWPSPRRRACTRTRSSARRGGSPPGSRWTRKPWDCRRSRRSVRAAISSPPT